MKKIIILCICLCICLIVGGFVILSSQIRNQDQMFLQSLSKGLEERWELNDEFSARDNTMRDVEEIEVHEEFVNAELNHIKKYANLKFTDNELQKLSIKYINLLEKQKSSLEKIKKDYKNGNDDCLIDRYSSSWYEGFIQRAKLIKIFYEKYGLKISDKYKPILANMNKVLEKTVEYEAFKNELRNSEFKFVKSGSEGYDYYEAVIENTSPYDFHYFKLYINLIDKDGNIVDDSRSSVNNWKVNEKVKFGFWVKNDIKFETISTGWTYTLKLENQTKEKEVEEAIKKEVENNLKIKPYRTKSGDDAESYDAIFENTLPYDLDYFTLYIDLIDKDGVTVCDVEGTVNNWKSGEKVTLLNMSLIGYEYEKMNVEWDYRK